MTSKYLREAAAKLSEAEATCGCGGKHGRCTVDDYPLAIAGNIREMPLP